ncbi:MAG TPA: glycosyltransferase family 4 protein [Puia sp.]
MKVVLISRATLYSVKGGDSVQVLQTAKQLGRLGISADVKLTNEPINYSNYDLLHFFNITRPADILFHIRKAGKPFVISTILIDYSNYDQQYRKGLPGIFMRLFPADNLEYVKCIARYLKGQDKLMTLSYLWMGQNRSIRELLLKASLLFSNSQLETTRIEQQFRIKTNCIPVHNGVDTELFRYNDSLKKDKYLVLCAARIEGIKNQLNLIRALRGTEYTLLLVGAPAPNHQSYYRECRKIASSNIRFIGFTDQAELVHYYQRAKVHVLPSWFEACGLSSMEAAAMGCNIVITSKGYTREYYGEYAFYCDPGSPDSIFKAVNEAANAGFRNKLREKILSDYTWPKAASRIARAYHQILPADGHPEGNSKMREYFQSLQEF